MVNFKLVGICGSLRKESFNMAVLNTVSELLPKDVDFEILEIGSIPLYNQDDEANMPAAVLSLKKSLEDADAILIATPEYNRSITGVLKNAIDWASRPYGNNSFDDKPVATVGATEGAVIGTAVAQYHLRQIFSFLNAHPVERPQIFIANAADKIKRNVFVDEETRRLIKDLVEKLIAWAKRLNPD